MKLHANAPLGPKGRATMVRRVTEEGLTLAEAAEAAGVSVRTAGKWVRRYRAEGESGLLEMATSTVSAVLKRIGLGKLSRLEPPEPVRRYEKRHPGELIHIDVKRLGRIGPHGAGHRITGRKGGGRRSSATPPASTAAKSAGSASTSASTIAPAWPTSRCSPTRRPQRRSAFFRRAVAF